MRRTGGAADRRVCSLLPVRLTRRSFESSKKTGHQGTVLFSRQRENKIAPFSRLASCFLAHDPAAEFAGAAASRGMAVAAQGEGPHEAGRVVVDRLARLGVHQPQL